MGKPPFKKFVNYRAGKNYMYNQSLPAVLKDQVPEKSMRKKSAPCLQEMSMMLVCFQKHEYMEKPCGKEIEIFLNCQKVVTETKRQKLEAESRGIFSKEGGKINSRKVNVMLKQYPQPR